MKKIILIFAGVGVVIIAMLVVAAYVPSSLPVETDFSAIYYTERALVHGASIYITSQNGDSQSPFAPGYFPYPPWYALSAFYLGFLPIRPAATLWFEINLVMLFSSLWLLTDGWSSRLRLIALPLGLSFLPVLGALSVGQYDFPVLLGVALSVYSWRKKNIALIALGASLLTFKPHIGALPLAVVLIHSFKSQNDFGRRALLSIAAAGIFLFLIGFVADPAWLVNYPTMLLRYQGEGNVAACPECASAPIYLSQWFFDGSFSQAAKIGLVGFVALAFVFFANRKTLSQSLELSLSSALLITLLTLPYLHNYDFVLLLVPFITLAPKIGNTQQALLIVCYLAPALAIALYGRAGNISLIVVTVIMTCLLFYRAKSEVDVPELASYNTNQ